MGDRTERIAWLLREVKSKIERVIASNVSIREFNFKLEALITAFEAHKAHSSVDNHEGVLKPVSSNHSEEHHVVDNKVASRCVPDAEYADREEGLEKFIGRLNSSLPDNRLLRSNAVKIAEYLYSNREGAVLEEIMKNTSMSKYRCVEVLNTMLRTDPPLLLKRFDRSFIYSILLL